MSFSQEMEGFTDSEQKYEIGIGNQLKEAQQVLFSVKRAECMLLLCAVFSVDQKDKVKLRKDVINVTNKYASQKDVIVSSIPKALQRKYLEAVKMK